MPVLANKSLFVLKKWLLFYCTLLLSTDSWRKILAGAKPSWACSVKWFILSAGQFRDLPQSGYTTDPTQKEGRHRCYGNGMNLPTWRRPRNVQGSNLSQQFLKWSVKEPDRCPTPPKYNSKSGRWHQVKPPALMGSLVPLVVAYKKWTCPTSKEAVPGLLYVQRRISQCRK